MVAIGIVAIILFTGSSLVKIFKNILSLSRPMRQIGPEHTEFVPVFPQVSNFEVTVIPSQLFLDYWGGFGI